MNESFDIFQADEWARHRQELLTSTTHIHILHNYNCFAHSGSQYPSSIIPEKRPRTRIIVHVGLSQIRISESEGDTHDGE
jgi:hypothetical protein